MPSPSTLSSIQPHNLKAADVWDTGGSAYNSISHTVADAIEHCVIRLDPKPGESVLDVATGTGWAARRLAERGANVTGIDIGSALIDAARAYATAARLNIRFEVADAEALPFENESFDAVTSTFGVMFTAKPEDAARELARVCRKGGRIALTTWPPDGTVAGLFKVMKPYMPEPFAPVPSPFDWGSKDRLQQLFGSHFDLKFETGTTVLREPSGQAAWALFASSYGPVKALAASLDPERHERFREEFIDYHDSFRTDLGIAMPRIYLMTLGIRA